uniref:BTB domain-containing protein n=1 Tax=Oryza brachyantha TaxID=4533 RepID=J3MRC6_ORYBR
MNRAIGVRKFISSGKFTVGDSDWAISSSRRTENDEARAWFGVRLLGKTQKTTWRIATTRMFRARGGADRRSLVSGWDRFLERTVLDDASHDLLWNNRLSIECCVYVLGKPLVSSAIPMSPPPSSSSLSSAALTNSSSSDELSRDFGKPLESKDGGDVVFLVKGEEFAAHKAVLAVRWPVTVEEMEPAAFGALLHFIYTNTLSPQLIINGGGGGGVGSNDKNEMLRHVLAAADRYGMEKLKDICEMELCRTVSAETLSATFTLADQHHCNKLKEHCFRFMSAMGDEITTIYLLGP